MALELDVKICGRCSSAGAQPPCQVCQHNLATMAKARERIAKLSEACEALGAVVSALWTLVQLDLSE